METITIRKIDNGYEVNYQSLMHKAENYSPTLGLALEDLVYQALRDEGTDIPKYVTPENYAITNDKDSSELLQSLFAFAKTFFYRAVKSALTENQEDIKEMNAKEVPA